MKIVLADGVGGALGVTNSSVALKSLLRVLGLTLVRIPAQWGQPPWENLGLTTPYLPTLRLIPPCSITPFAFGLIPRGQRLQVGHPRQARLAVR